MNRYIVLILLALLLTVSTQAQRLRVGEHSSGMKRISREYNNMSLSDALSQLAEQQTDYAIMFLYNELEDFRITTTVSRKTLPDAIQQMIGFYPIRMTVDTSPFHTNSPLLSLAFPTSVTRPSIGSAVNP